MSRRSSESVAGPRIVAWEVTRRCPLACRHCRAGAVDRPYENELSTDECLKVLDSLAAFTRPMIIWTGGEPMSRPDLLRLVRGATDRLMRSVLAPCGMLVTPQALEALYEAGISACSFSLDGDTAQTHDDFRGVKGAFAHVTAAMKVASQIGMPFQVNCTVSRRNFKRLDAIRDLAIQMGARTLDLFFLVPVGRGRGIADLALDSSEAEEVLRWAFAQDAAGPIAVRETCMPQAVRVWEAAGRVGRHPSGCLGGREFVFISHVGELQPCGFLDLVCGDLRAVDFDFRRAYETSEVFASMRNPNGYQPTCGTCRFRFECGGCRARAYSAAGDCLAADPSCALNARA